MGLSTMTPLTRCTTTPPRTLRTLIPRTLGGVILVALETVTVRTAVFATNEARGTQYLDAALAAEATAAIIAFLVAVLPTPPMTGRTLTPPTQRTTITPQILPTLTPRTHETLAVLAQVVQMQEEVFAFQEKRWSIGRTARSPK